MAMEMNRRRPLGSDMAREGIPLRTMMDRIFENAFMPSAFGTGSGMGSASWFGADVDEDDNAYYVSCHLPGIDANDVTISAQGNVLTISGETKRQVRQGRRSISQESSVGQFERHFGFDTPVDASRAEASYRDGILEITLPKAEAHRPRTIQIKRPGQRDQGTGQASRT